MPQIKEPPKRPDGAATRNRCMVCAEKESDAKKGSRFHAEGENGMQLFFWMCNDCAIKNGPDQGPIDIDDPSTRV